MPITDKPKLDSFRVYIPIENISIIDKRLNTSYVKYYHEIELVDEVINDEKSLIVGHADATTKYQIMQRLFNNENREVLCILVKSKILEDNYLSGITKDNIKELYNIIINQKVVYFTIEEFMASKITDIDICIDYSADQYNVSQIIKQISKMVVYPNYKHHFETKTGESLVLNKREKATPSKPHFKVYDKFAEMNNNSAEFRDNHIGDAEFNRLKQRYGGLIRLEYTIKNKKHLNRLGLKFNDLRDVLNMSDKMMTEIVESGLHNYINKNKMNKDKEQSTTDTIISNLIDILVIEGYGEETIKSVCEDIENSSQRSKWKKRIKNLMNKTVDQETLNKNNKVEEFLVKIKAI